MAVALLLHEVWMDPEGNPSCFLAGPMGDEARAMEPQGSRLVWQFEAGSIFEAMTIYNRYLGRGPYTTEYASDYEPYPDDWLAIQRGRPN